MRDLFLRYTLPGQTILDPFGGIGGALIGCTLGRNVILHELEAPFVEHQRRNEMHLRSHALGDVPLGSATILQGDSRHLPLPDGDVAAAITSPPYADLASRDRSAEPYSQNKDPELRAKYGSGDTNRHVDGYGDHTPGQIGDLPHDTRRYLGTGPQIDTIDACQNESDPICAPTVVPLVGTAAAVSAGGQTPTTRGVPTAPSTGGKSARLSEGCPAPTCRVRTIPSGRGGRLAGAAQAPCSSTEPRESETEPVRSAEARRTSKRITSFRGSKAAPRRSKTSSRSASRATPNGTPSDDPSQNECICALNVAGSTLAEAPDPDRAPRSAAPSGSAPPHSALGGSVEPPNEPENYATACLAVYRECFRVVRSGGVLVLIVGPYVRNGTIVDLAADSIRLAEAAGWTPVERWRHEKAQISFWRRLHAQQAAARGRDPHEVTVTHEDVLVFCKGEKPGWEFAELPPTHLAPVEIGAPKPLVPTSAAAVRLPLPLE